MSKIKGQFYDEKNVQRKLTGMESEIKDERATQQKIADDQVKIEGKITNESQTKRAHKSQATILVGLASEAELFHTREGEPYATIEVKDHKETWHLKSRSFRDWLMQRFYIVESSVPSSQATQDALGV